MNVVSKEYIIKKLALEFDKNKLIKPAIEYTDVHGMRVTKVIDLAIMPTVSEFIAKLEEDLRTLNHEVIIDNDDLFVFRITVVGPVVSLIKNITRCTWLKKHRIKKLYRCSSLLIELARF